MLLAVSLEGYGLHIPIYLLNLDCSHFLNIWTIIGSLFAKLIGIKKFILRL
jgi:hypothetical protein